MCIQRSVIYIQQLNPSIEKDSPHIYQEMMMVHL